MCTCVVTMAFWTHQKVSHYTIAIASVMATALAVMVGIAVLRAGIHAAVGADPEGCCRGALAADAVVPAAVLAGIGGGVPGAVSAEEVHASVVTGVPALGAVVIGGVVITVGSAVGAFMWWRVAWTLAALALVRAEGDCELLWWLGPVLGESGQDVM